VRNVLTEFVDVLREQCFHLVVVGQVGCKLIVIIGCI